jgi:tetratricopeptide (TPR) repeat protein
MKRATVKRAAVILVLAATTVRADAGHDAHLFAGAQHFQAGRYAEALVEFRVAERLAPDGGPAWYVAATLVKLKRPDEALSAFARAEATDPADRDGLFDYYHALACYDARLYHCADRLLAAVGEGAGPRISAQARKVRGDLAPVLASSAPHAAIDWYHAHAQSALRTGDTALAAAYLAEAVDWSAARPDAYRLEEARGALVRVRGKTPPLEPKP